MYREQRRNSINNLLDLLEMLSIKSAEYMELPDRPVDDFVNKWNENHI